MPPNNQNPQTPPVEPTPPPVQPASQQPAPNPVSSQTPQSPVGGATSPAPKIASDTQVKTKQLKGKVIKIIIAVIALMVIGTIVAIILVVKSQKYSASDLTTYSDDTVTFKYPKSWQKVTSIDTAKVAYGEKSEVAKATAVIIYSSTDIGVLPGVKLSDSEASAVQTELKTLANSAKTKSSLEKTAGCKGSGELSASDLKNDVLLGQKLDFTCKRDKGQAVEVIAYLGIAKDNKLHTIEVDAIKSAWDINKSVFTSMLDSLTVK